MGMEKVKAVRYQPHLLMSMVKPKPNGLTFLLKIIYKNARQARLEFNQIDESSTEIKSNAGYVRAAFYISNESVNMPVKMTNILCSFMFESPDGTLIPVQSFRLRNDDYSLFEVELYGNTTFGPYVIELKNLNTMQMLCRKFRNAGFHY